MDFKEKIKPMLGLEPIFINRFSGKLKPRAKIIYVMLSVLCVLGALDALVSLFTMGLNAFIIKTLIVCISFIVVRMFSEYLYNRE